MQPTRLNLSALRGNRVPHAKSAGLTPAQVVASSDAITLTRREFLGMAGVATVGLSPALKALETAALGPFELVADEGRAAFILGGKERWVIDTRRFGGSPKLKVERSNSLIRLELTGARYPGTELPADFACELHQGIIGWQMKLNLTLGSFKSEVPFERWLIGVEPARSDVRLKTLVCKLNDASRIALSGAAEAEFSPNWTLRLNGSNIVTLSGLGGEAVSDSLTLFLLDPTEPSLMETVESKRTLLVMERGEHAWQLGLVPDVAEGGKLIACDNPFDVLHVEAAESEAGLSRRALLAESRTEEAKLSFQPDGPLTDSEGKSFALPLRNARCAVAFDPSGDQTALIAQFDKDSVWLCADGYSLELGDAPNTPPFELVSSNGKIETMRCEPALLRVAAPLPDAIVEPTPAPEGTRMAFVGGAASEPKQPNVGVVSVTKEVAAVVQLPTSPPLRVWRPDDLLVLGFEFINLQVKGGQLVRTGTPAYIVVHFPPQSIAEEAFPEFVGAPQPGPPPVKSRLAGPSRLVFTVPSNVNQIPYTLESLLRVCSQYELSVAPTAQPPPPLSRIRPLRFVPGARTKLTPSLIQPQPPAAVTKPTPVALTPRPAEPAPNQTAIEVPYRLILSPNQYAAWVHSVSAVTHKGRTELWHTRLAIRNREGMIFEGKYVYGWIDGTLKVLQVSMDEDPETFGIYYRTLRAIWTPGYQPRPASLPAPADSPFKTSLNDYYRHQIVRLTGDPATEKWTERVIQGQRLMLTSLGAWMDVQYAMEPPKDLALIEWRHQMTMGRDHYVRVVEKGFLFPFGHRAVKVEITERKFHPELPGNPAYLRKRIFIAVQEPEKFYETAGLRVGGKLIDLQNPFKRIRIMTLVTPNLDPIVTVPGLPQESAFWPRVGNRDFLFHIVAEDVAGQRCEFTAPLIWVRNDIRDNEAQMKSIANHYATSKDEKGALRAQRDLDGQEVAFADSNEPGDTTFEVESITFGAVVPPQSVKLPPNHEPRFYPVIAQAEVRIPAIEQLLGKNVPTTVKFHDTYLTSGFGGANKGQVFLDVVNKPKLDFTGSGDKAGGVVTPNFVISGLSRLFGPVGGNPNTVASGQFDPEDFFKETLEEAKILGGMSLGKILLKVVDIVSAVNRKKAPTLAIVHVLNPVTKMPQEKHITLTWETDSIKSVDIGVLTFTRYSGNPSKDGEPGGGEDTTKLFVKASLTSKREAPGQPLPEPTYYVEGVLNNFAVTFLKCIRIEFNTFRFRVEKGKSPSPSPSIRKVDFLGPLSFVEKLSDVISLGSSTGKSSGGGGGGGSPSPVTFKPYVKPMLSPLGVKAGFELGVNVPPMGAFSLRDVVLGVEGQVPFTGDPVTLKFNFCKPEKPFILTVWIFGGGGSFGMEVPVKEPAEIIISASFEFGAMFAMDIGVASGEAHLAAGFIFHYEGGSKLTGYLRCGGALDILSIVTLSVEFRMELNYDDTTTPTRIWGRATVTVTIEILFFSKSIDLTVEREFAGSSRHLPFTEMVTQEQWEEYCEAFA